MGTLAWIAFIVWCMGLMTNKKLGGAIHIFLAVAVILWVLK